MNALIRRLFKQTRSLMNCLKRETSRNEILSIICTSPETKLIAIGPIIQPIIVAIGHATLQARRRPHQLLFPACQLGSMLAGST